MKSKSKRVLTNILKRIGDGRISDDGPVRSEEIARLYWELACTGRVTFPDGREVKASIKDWKDCIQWIYTHVDGPAKVEQAIALGMEQQLGETPLAELQRIVASALDTGTAALQDEETSEEDAVS